MGRHVQDDGRKAGVEAPGKRQATPAEAPDASDLGRYRRSNRRCRLNRDMSIGRLREVE